MERPLIPVALLFAVGIGLAQMLAPPAPSRWSLLISLPLLLFFLLSSFRHARILALAAALSCGMIRAWPTVEPPAATSLQAGEELHLSGVITADAVPRYTKKGDFAWVVPVDVGQDTPTRLEVWCFAFDPDRAPPALGDRWRFSGRLSEQTLTSHGPQRMFVRWGGWKLEQAEEGHRFVRGCHAARQAAWTRLGRGVDGHDDAVAITRALILGYSRELTPALRERFSAVGAMHLFAVSGLHVAIVASGVILLLRWGGVSRIRWPWIVIPVVIAYTVGTGMKISAIRACIMLTAYWSALLIRRKPDGPSALALAAIVILAWMPHQLSSPGFILSFSIVAGLMYFYPLLDKFGAPFVEGDPFNVVGLTGRDGIGRKVRRYLWGLCATSFICWVVSEPLIAHYFGILSPVGLFANLVVVPMGFLILTCGVCSIVFGSIVPIVGVGFNYVNVFLTTGLLKFIDLCIAIPGSHYQIPKLPLWAALLFYALLIGGVLKLKNPRPKHEQVDWLRESDT